MYFKGSSTFHRRPLFVAAIICVICTVAGINFCGSVSKYIAALFIPLFVILATSVHGNRRLFFSLVSVALISFAYSAFRAQPVQEAAESFAFLCGTKEKVTVQGTVFAMRPPGLASRGEEQYKFSLKDASFRLKGEKTKLGVPVPVVWYATSPQNGGFIPKPGMNFEMTGCVCQGKNGDPAEPEIDEVFVVSRASSTRIFDSGTESGFLMRCRDRAAEVLRLGIEDMPEETSLLLAMTLGYRAELSKSLSNSFKRAGTVHLFAISGLHVGAIALILVYLMSFIGLSRKFVIIPLAPLLAAYVYMTGMQPSAIRAAIMISFFYLAPLFGRRPDVINSISATVIAIIAVNPLEILELGLVLSFSMVLGIVIFTGPVSTLLKKLFSNPDEEREHKLALQSEASGDPDILVDRWPRDFLIKLRSFLVELFSAAIAAALVSFPLTAYFFGILTPYSIIANVVVVPLAFYVMAISGGGLFISIIFPSFAILTNRIAACIAWVMKSVSEGVSELPCSAFYTEFPLWGLVAWYALLIFLLKVIPCTSGQILNPENNCKI